MKRRIPMSYNAKKHAMKASIDSMEKGEKFKFNDVASDAPIVLGRRLYSDVKSGKIENVKCITKPDDNVQEYEKL